MKKIFLKYLIEFIVIVVGISVSFWFDKYQISLDNIEKENQVIKELSTEMDLIESTVESREKAFRYDYENLKRIINNKVQRDSFTYEELLIATTDYRGFSPSEEIYTSLKYDGGLKFIRNNQIKIAIEALYNGTKYGVIANMEDEIVVQRDVLKYILPEEITTNRRNAPSQNLINTKESAFIVFGHEKITDFDNAMNSLVGCCSRGTGHLDSFINS